MKKPLEITYRHMKPSEALDAAVSKYAAKLEKICDEIVSCTVIFEEPHKHHRKGNLFHFSVVVTVPGRQIVVRQSQDDNHAHEDPYVSLRDAFEGVRRQLQDHMRKRRGDVKRHESPPCGRIIDLQPALDFGRLETPDGREIYFHRNSLVHGDFDELELGTELRFTEEAGDKGPQATSVRIVGKHHPYP